MQWRLRCIRIEKLENRRGLTYDDNRTCLFDGKTLYREQMLFENKKYKVYTVNKHRVALNRDERECQNWQKWHKWQNKKSNRKNNGIKKGYSAQKDHVRKQEHTS